jgi:hypothetical protein
VEAAMTTENWAEERTRLTALLRDYEAGTITRFDEIGLDALEGTTSTERIAAIKARLAALDERLGSDDEGG